MSNQQKSGTVKLAVVTAICYVVYQFTQSVPLPPVVGWIFLALFLLGVFKTGWSLFEDWGWRKFFESAATPTGLYGRTDHVGLNELVQAGLKTENPDGNGIPLGAIGDKMLFYSGAAHLSFRAATGGGKTESSFAPICLALGPHRNILATGKGKEPACLVAKHRQNIGQEVRVIDLGNQMGGTEFQPSDFNPAGHLVEFADQGNSVVINEARKIASTLIAEPKGGAGGDNIFFRNQARKWLTWLLVGAAILEATTGELCCNLPYLYTQVNSGDDQLRTFLTDLTTLNQYEKSVSGAAKRMLSKWKNAAKTFEAVLSEVENALEIYDPASHLGQHSVYSDFDPCDIKRKPMTILLVTDPTQSDTHGIAAGLCLEVITNLALQANSFEPRLSIIADEFANLSKGALPSMLPALYVGRSLGTQLLSYIQDTSSYKSRYGEEASAFTTQSEIVLSWKCSSTKDADEYSKRSGQISVMSESTNLPKGAEADSNKSYSVGMSEKGLPRYRPDDFLHMKDFQAALFFKQLPTVMIDLVSYRQVLPWRNQAGVVPGAPPQDDLPVRFHL
ncbi:hypothetical protein NBRC116602_07010 [Hyphomicrobiales bacterium 4NK60-0047b]